MVDLVSSSVLVGHARLALVRRWALTPAAAHAALQTAAEEDGVDVGVVAALVCADELRHQSSGTTSAAEVSWEPGGMTAASHRTVQPSAQPLAQSWHVARPAIGPWAVGRSPAISRRA